MFTWSRLAAAAALCCMVAPAGAQSAPALNSLQIVIDADTGRPRMPTHEEAASFRESSALTAAQRSAALASHPLLQRMHGRPVAAEMGAVAMRAPASRLSYLVARRGADGKLETVCVTGEEAAAKALAGVASPRRTDHAH